MLALESLRQWNLSSKNLFVNLCINVVVVILGLWAQGLMLSKTVSTTKGSFTVPTVPTLNVSGHKQRSYWSLKLPNHALCSPLLHNVSFHKRIVRASLSRMSISACVFLTGKRVTRPWCSAKQLSKILTGQ